MIKKGFIYLFFCLLMITIVSNKENLYEDEVFSYGLANCQKGPKLKFKQGVTYEPAKLPYMEYVTVKNDGRFDYANVWKNQSRDSHPPLYYVILHTICSLFPQRYSIWYAAGINIFFSLLTLFVLKKLIYLLTDHNETICWLISMAFVLSPGILSTVCFFRMYMMAMYWITLITFLLVNEIGRESNWKFYTALFFTAVAGALTHYYCIIFTILICFVYGIYLLIERKWRDVAWLCLAGGVSGITAYSLFPSMIRHMFFGSRGSEAIENLEETAFSVFWERVKQFYHFVNQELFGNILSCVIAVLIVSVLVNLLLCKKTKRQIETGGFSAEKRLLLKQYTLVIIPVIAYFLFVSKTASFIVDRYMFPIYALLLSVVICLLYLLGRKILNKKVIVPCFALLLSVLTISGWRSGGVQYLYKDTVALLETAERYSDVDCLYIYDKAWKAQASFYQVSHYKSVTFVKNNNLDLLPSLECAKKKELIVMCLDEDETVINRVLEEYPMLSVYEKMEEMHGYTRAYYLYGGEKEE